MRRPVVIALVAVVVVLVGVTAVLFQKYRKSTSEYADMKAAEEAARSGYSETFKAIAEIQDSLNAIAVGDTTVRMLAHDLQGEQKPTEEHRREALERVSVLKASIQRNKQRIQQLEAGLRKNGVKVAGLEKLITGLKQTVADKEAMVQQLGVRVDSLQTTVSGLQTTVAQNQEAIRVRDLTIEDHRRELATIYYRVADKKSLLADSLITAKGGLLGLGKTLLASGRTNERLFTALDTDHETVIPIAAGKAQVLSAQPPSSYELKASDGKMELRILDPKEFRKVKHLIVMTK